MVASVIGQLIQQPRESKDVSEFKVKLDKLSQKIQLVETELPEKVQTIALDSFDSPEFVSKVEAILNRPRVAGELDGERWSLAPGVYLGEEVVTFLKKIGIPNLSELRLKKREEIIKLCECYRDGFEEVCGGRSLEDWCGLIVAVAEKPPEAVSKKSR